MGSRPKAPKASAAETAIIRRQGMELDETMAANEKRLKAMRKQSSKSNLLTRLTNKVTTKRNAEIGYSGERK